MATMWIGEFRGGLTENGVPTNAYVAPPIKNQAVTFSGTSGASAAIDAGAGLVSIVCDAAAYVVFGATAPTATSAGVYMPANVIRDFALPPGLRFVAAITA